MNSSSNAAKCGGGLLVALLLTLVAGSAYAQFSVSRFTIDGGGGTSSGGVFALGGTIGQPDAGRLSGGSFTLSGGFWGGGATATAVAGPTPEDGGSLKSTPRVFRMYAASPNPLAERTVVAFDLPSASLVRAELYDVSGRLVRRLADESLPAGKHQLAWDRRDQSGQPVASGIYFLRLDAGARSQGRQKIIVVS